MLSVKTTSNSAGKLDVSHHHSDSLCVDRAKIPKVNTKIELYASSKTETR